jgi:membrane-associated phospholipid phosphatase
MKDLLYDFWGYNHSIFYALNKFCSIDELQLTLLYISKIFDIENFAIYYILAAIIGLGLLKLSSSGFSWSFSNLIQGSINNKYVLSPRMTPSAFYDFMIKLGISYACFGLFYALLKFTINMPRPFCSLPLESFTTIIDITHERCLSSFPSSHVGLAILIALNIWPYISLRIRLFSVLIIILVALSRIGLAMHYPADIFYSIFITYFVFLISRLVYRLFENNIIKWVKKLVIK